MAWVVPQIAQNAGRRTTVRQRPAVLISTFVALAACQPHASTGVSAEHRPRGRVHVEYTGSGIHRRVRAEFATDRDAYVLVGHVAGNGRVHILFPENAADPGQIKGGQTYEIAPFSADYDAAPSLYSLSPAPARSAGAQMDSYDGA